MIRINLVILIVILGTSDLFAQNQVSVTREFSSQGTFGLLVGDEMTMVDVDGRQQTLRIQQKARRPIGLTGGNIALEQLAEIEATGKLAVTALVPGMTVSINSTLGSGGKTGPIESWALLEIGSDVDPVSVEQMPAGRELVPAMIQGRIKSIDDKRVVLSVPRHELVRGKTLTFSLANAGDLDCVTKDLAMVRKGDVVTRVDAAELSTTDSVVRRIKIELVGTRKSRNLSVDELLLLKYQDVSDEPFDEPREYRSQHYLLMTDSSERQARILLEKLETMFDLVASYYNKQPSTMLEVYVVRELAYWNTAEWDPRVITKVRQGEGTTIYARQGRNQKAVVFSTDDHDVVQHEAVHGFCFLTFQGTGPLWYAEGIAEMGQYWRPDSLSVAADPAVIGYLRSRDPPDLNTVVNATRIEGDAWKAYAWRWTLCHFLSTNPNYSKEFRKLGVGLMKNSRGASFENSWRRQANELTFEYHHFLKHVEDGLRADLIAWQWRTRFVKTSDSRAIQKKILANRGWQATGALVESGTTYETQSKGEWSLAENTAVDADGTEDGRGKMVGVVMNENYELSDEILLGAESNFEAPSSGQLYVRCKERMSLIGDNSGEIDFAIRKKK